MDFDMSPLVALDGRLQDLGISVEAVRLTQTCDEGDREAKYAFAARLTKQGRWPSLQVACYLFDDVGLLVHPLALELTRASSSTERHAHTSTLTQSRRGPADFSRAELVIVEGAPSDPALADDPPRDGWTDIAWRHPLGQPDLGLGLDHVTCQWRQSFDAENLLLLSAAVSVSRTTADVFPEGLVATFTAFDRHGQIAATGERDISAGSSTAPRTASFTAQCYKHLTPAHIEISLRTEQTSTAPLDLGEGGGYRKLTKIAGRIDAKLDRLLELIERDG